MKVILIIIRFTVLCVHWIYVHESQASVMCQRNRQYYGRKHYWHFSFLHKCSWLHIMPKAVSFYYFFYISALWAHCHNAVTLEWFRMIKKRDRGLLTESKPTVGSMTFPHIKHHRGQTHATGGSYSQDCAKKEGKQKMRRATKKTLWGVISLLSNGPFIWYV